jgi:hypothetical protein
MTRRVPAGAEVLRGVQFEVKLEEGAVSARKF